MSNYYPFIYNNSILFFNNQVLAWDVSTGGTGTGYVSQYQTVYNSFTTKPSSGVAAAQNTMVKSLVDNGVWSKLDLFYCFAQEVSSGGEALKNWVTPGTYNATLVGNPSFNSLEGYTGNVSSNLQTNYDASLNNINFQKSAGSIGDYVRNNLDGTIASIGGDSGWQNLYIYPKYNSGYMASRIQSGSSNDYSVTDSYGLHISVKTDSTHITNYKNNNALGSSTVVLNENVPGKITILSAGTDFRGGRQVSIAFVGGILTNADVSTMYAAIDTYMTSAPIPPYILRDGSTVAWYRSDVPSTLTLTVDSSVSTWKDYLGSGHDLLQATVIYEPKWSATGILFDGVNDRLITNTFVWNRPEFIYMVARTVSWTYGNRIFDGSISNSGQLEELTSPQLYTNNGGGLYVGDDTNYIPGNWSIFRIGFDPSVNSIQINNNTKVTDTNSGHIGTGNMSGFTLGAAGSGGLSNWANIEVKEIICRNCTDTSTDNTKIYNYLKTKYSL